MLIVASHHNDIIGPMTTLRESHRAAVSSEPLSRWEINPGLVGQQGMQEIKRWSILRRRHANRFDKFAYHVTSIGCPAFSPPHLQCVVLDEVFPVFRHRRQRDRQLIWKNDVLIDNA